MTTPRNTASDAPTRAPARKGQGGNAGWLIALGSLFLVFAGLAITLQTQTGEAYINGQSQTSTTIQAEWGIWLQIPKLMLGNAVPGDAITSNDLPGIFIGQGMELVYVGLLSSVEIALLSGKKMGRLLAAFVIIVLISIAFFDFYTDLVYGNVSQTAHIFFAIFCTFAVGFFPTWGIALIEHGYKKL